MLTLTWSPLARTVPLDAVHARIRLLLAAPDTALDYGRGSELAHATDDIVVSEIENRQAVFGGKHGSVPV